MPSDRVLSVGFVNERPDAAAHAQAFDAVVVGDQGSLNAVIEIVDEIAPPPLTPIASISRSFSRLGLSRSHSGRQ